MIARPWYTVIAEGIAGAPRMVPFEACLDEACTISQGPGWDRFFANMKSLSSRSVDPPLMKRQDFEHR